MFDFLKIMLDSRLAKMEERGASAVEYGLLVAAIAAVIIIVIFTLGGTIRDMFGRTCDSIGSKSGGASSCARS
jgi:pilus assembly protein Flp/PilA